MMTIAELPSGFADKVMSAQSTFRRVMDAMAHPGIVQRVQSGPGAPGGMMPGMAALALTLFDHDTPVWLDDAMLATPDIAQWLKFHTSAPIVGDSAIASFALVGDPHNLPALDRFALGSSEYPDRSTSLILPIASLTQGPAFQLRGPGIDGTASLRATIQPADLFERLAINIGLFPRGIDVVLVDDDRIAAIPRTTRLVGRGD